MNHYKDKHSDFPADEWKIGKEEIDAVMKWHVSILLFFVEKWLILSIVFVHHFFVDVFSDIFLTFLTILPLPHPRDDGLDFLT